MPVFIGIVLAGPCVMFNKPGVVMVIARDLIAMNNLFLRMSTYVEVKEELYRGDKLFLQRAAGHDLQGRDIQKYFAALEAEPSFYLSSDAEEQRRLNQEREFSDMLLKPLLSSKPASVILSVVVDYRAKSVVSHEILHGQFFLNEQLRNAVIDFWRTVLSAEDKDSFKDYAQATYNVNDESLMANEFFAHILQQEAEVYLEHRPKVVALVYKYRDLFLNDLATKGIKLVR